MFPESTGVAENSVERRYLCASLTVVLSDHFRSDVRPQISQNDVYATGGLRYVSL